MGSSSEGRTRIVESRINFTVDNTVNFITVFFANGFFNIYDPTFGTQMYFVEDDNITIEKMQVLMPYCFNFSGAGGVLMSIKGRTGGGLAFPMFDGGLMAFAAPNQWVDINQYIPFSSFSGGPVGSQDYMLNRFSGYLNISMIGVPDSLHGVTLTFTIQFIVRSTYEVRA